MNNDENNQNNCIYKGRGHIIISLPGLIILSVFIIILIMLSSPIIQIFYQGLMIANVKNELANNISIIIYLIIILIPIYVFLNLLIKYLTTNYEIYNNKIILMKGGWTRNLFTIHLSNYIKVDCTQNILESIFNVGTIRLLTSGSPAIYLRGIKKPRKIMEKIEPYLDHSNISTTNSSIIYSEKNITSNKETYSPKKSVIVHEGGGCLGCLIMCIVIILIPLVILILLKAAIITTIITLIIETIRRIFGG